MNHSTNCTWLFRLCEYTATVHCCSSHTHLNMANICYKHIRSMLFRQCKYGVKLICCLRLVDLRIFTIRRSQFPTSRRKYRRPSLHQPLSGQIRMTLSMMFFARGMILHIRPPRLGIFTYRHSHVERSNKNRQRTHRLPSRREPVSSTFHTTGAKVLTKNYRFNRF
jgi:hypothetical protein